MSEVRLRGQVPFPDGGEGVYLRFTNPDLDNLQAKFGDNYFADCVPRLNRFDPKFMRECIAFGGKKDGKPFRIAYDDLDCPQVVTANAILDALFLAMHGRTFEGHLDYLENVRKLEVNDDSGNQSSPASS
ncbi:hypothetical protein MPL3356_60478 [Mesorhizobium plurifarium]|uniref:Uncharacterized protein n=1 Tax=Mesorhizobium plurifarium TaxID=69974 RepID=A0A090EEV6_MESPL|nr:hypothetical protein MPL3356_60478 [Mesorhizobium plurifarium]